MTPLKMARKKMEFSQQAVANQVGCSQAYLSDLEKNKYTASPALAKKLSELLQLSVVDIL